EEAKAEAAKRESEVRKEELIDLLGQEVVNKKDGTSEIIPNFKASDLHLGKWREVMKDIPLRKDDPLDILNDLANKKRKHADDIHDYFKANKRLKSSFQYEYHLPGIVLNEPILASSATALRVSGPLEDYEVSSLPFMQRYRTLKKDPWLELSDSWVGDNSKLNVVLSPYQNSKHLLFHF
ncbi:hypothetical protein Tco_0979483, partial [Tanacetum coccineum]